MHLMIYFFVFSLFSFPSVRNDFFLFFYYRYIVKCLLQTLSLFPYRGWCPCVNQTSGTLHRWRSFSPCRFTFSALTWFLPACVYYGKQTLNGKIQTAAVVYALYSVEVLTLLVPVLYFAFITLYCLICFTYSFICLFI